MFAQRSGWLLAATWSLFITSSFAQTITIDGNTIGMTHHCAFNALSSFYHATSAPADHNVH